MATPAGQLIHILHNGAIVGGKTGATKKGGLGGRKALKDISNSRNPTVLQTKKDNSVNVVSTGKDVNASQTKSIVRDKVNFPGAPDKGKVSCKKALGDLTNSVKPIFTADIHMWPSPSRGLGSSSSKPKVHFNP
ncbi:protein PATRONUS 1-like [Forsythia ovata]|uniref:Protein PATRONUS 1-like n=1 Tax=Forsythia ovata TaxID=205694 RepID=A0ABD1X5F2_9LAMI